MMYFNHYELETKLEIKSDRINVLVVENNTKFFNYCKELISQQNGECGGFILFDDKKEYPIQKNVKVLYDFFDIDLNEKKMQTTLYNSLTTICQNDLLVDYTEMLSVIANFFEKLNSTADFEIDYSEDTQLSAILKAFGVVAKSETISLLSIMVGFVQFCSKLLKTKLFVFINLKTFLSEEDICALYKQLILDDIPILLLENTCRTKLDNEFITVIDKDLCEIIV